MAAGVTILIAGRAADLARLPPSAPCSAAGIRPDDPPCGVLPARLYWRFCPQVRSHGRDVWLCAPHGDALTEAGGHCAECFQAGGRVRAVFFLLPERTADMTVQPEDGAQIGLAIEADAEVIKAADVPEWQREQDRLAAEREPGPQE